MIKSLGDGLILRRATRADRGRLEAFHAAMHSDNGIDHPDEWVAGWVRELMSGKHPTFRPSDFTLVEDTATGSVVSSLCLISQTWSYEGIPFGLGQPEIIATHPDFRRRGLISTQMEVVHGWSARRGELVQGITGIPYYYRQFGYEMAMTLGGGRAGYQPLVPRLEANAVEPFCLRPASEADLPLVADLYATAVRRYPVACVRDEALWRFDLLGRNAASDWYRVHRVIHTPGGKPVGYLVHSARLHSGRLHADFYELVPGTSWLDVTPSVMRYLWAQGQTLGAQPGQDEFRCFRFSLGAEHPVYDLFRRALPTVEEPYAWYLRVPDLPRFLRRIAPALEARLAGSILAGYSGELTVSFYRSGLRLVFDQGRIVTVEPWQPLDGNGPGARFPDLTFLQLLFGYRSMDELWRAFADCTVRGDEYRVLVEVLFPKRPSHVWSVT